MTRVIFHTATTVDGFLATEEDSLDWLFATPGSAEAEVAFGSFLDGVGVLVMGSSTYEWLVRNENLHDEPERWQQLYGRRPSFVFSSRPRELVHGADIRMVAGSVDEQWDEIRKAAENADVWIVGGGDLAGQFADADLLDEIRLSIAPATLGSGKPLMPRVLGPERLTLLDAKRAGQFAELVYALRPASPGNSPS
ncbi:MULTISPECIES: dihydrofolate reductase family protein [Microbacterium]|jgi:dihydrofolate reductase|uniref:Dihydrofolate reductase family protein n=1 Tax=Microbacterium mcarthurae TaxID=3035918 RepID=A0ABW9GBM8_9MICO|nr:dihydrofolate reductase family protein [Microbacterium sp. ACRRU]MCG7417230.1 dihydrofolate reductase family protein [Microbacterium sp. ACRRU]